MGKKLLILTLFIALITHLSYIKNGYVWLDHNDFELQNALLPINNLYKAFFIPFGKTGFYRPLVTILNSLDRGSHITSLILHLLVVLVAAWFLSVFFKFNKFQIFLGSLTIALHSASIMVVGLLFLRQEMLLLLFSMLTVIFHSRSKKLLSCIFFFLALLSKETAIVVIPLFIFFWEYLNHKPQKNYLRLLFWEFCALLIYIFLRINAVPQFWSTKYPNLSLSQNIGTRLNLFLKFSLELISPLKPNFSDSTKIINLMNLQTLLTLILLTIFIYLIIKKGIKSDLGKAITIFFILILPSLNLIPVPRISSPHYLYLPVIGLAAIIMSVIPNIKNRFILSIVIIWLALASYSTFKSGFQFQNDLTLFTPEVEKDPNFLEAYYYLGKYHLEKGNADQAEIDFSNALKNTQGYLVFNNKEIVEVNLGAIKFEKGNLSQAEILYNDALTSSSPSLKPIILYNLALIADKKEDSQKVIELLSSTPWDKPEPLFLLAKAYHRLGHLDEETETIQKALFLAR